LIAGGGGHGFSQSQLSSSSLFGSASGAGGTPSGSVSDAVKIKGEDGVFAVSTGTITYEGGLRGARSGGPYGTTCRFIGGIPWHTEFISSSGPVAGKSIGGGAAGAGTAPSSAARDGAAGSAGIVIVRLIF
jgi:hypothetical protein